MITKILLFALLTLASSYAYRSGGISQDQPSPFPIPKWLRHSWVRDLFCPLFVCLAIALKTGFVWQLLSTYVLMTFAIKTYWDRLMKLITGVETDNFFLHGGVIGLCTLPLLAVGIHWYAIIAYSIALALWMGVGCALTDKDWVEEMICRGFPIVALTPLLLI